MTTKSAFFNLPHGNGFDALEVHTVTGDGDTCESHPPGEELPEDSPTAYWTLYGHRADEGGLEAIGDFTTFAAACDTARKLGGVEI